MGSLTAYPLSQLDLTFVRDLVRGAYQDGGRPSIDPIAFFKLQLIMFFEGIRSERQLIEIASLHLAHRWYLGFFPGGRPGPAVPLEDTGTEGPVTLSTGVPGRLMLSYLLPKTPQGDLGQGRASFYATKLPAPFSRADINGGWFTLTIHTDDVWVPDYFAVFGLNTSWTSAPGLPRASGRPRPLSKVTCPPATAR